MRMRQLPFVMDMLLMRMAAGDDGEPALIPRVEYVGPRKDLLVWPHPMDPCEDLFMVSDVAKQLTWAGTSRIHRGILATLSKLVDAVATVTGLGAEP